MFFTKSRKSLSLAEGQNHGNQNLNRLIPCDNQATCGKLSIPAGFLAERRGAIGPLRSISRVGLACTRVMVSSHPNHLDQGRQYAWPVARCIRDMVRRSSLSRSAPAA